MTTDQSPAGLYPTGQSARLAARGKTLTNQTAGIAPTYLQANLLVLPSRYADDFRLLCARNPVPCPLLADSAAPGHATLLRTHLKPSISTATDAPCSTNNGNKHTRGDDVSLEVAKDVDLRHDFPKYRVYQDSEPQVADVLDIYAQWTHDHVGFLIGCSYTTKTCEQVLGKFSNR